MMTQVQREALDLQAEILNLAPEIRLGQLWSFMGFLGHVEFHQSIDNLDDELMVQVLRRHRDNMARRLVDTE